MSTGPVNGSFCNVEGGRRGAMPCPRLLSMPLPSCCARITALPLFTLPILLFQRRPLCCNYTSPGTRDRPGCIPLKSNPLCTVHFSLCTIRGRLVFLCLNTMALICPLCVSLPDWLIRSQPGTPHLISIAQSEHKNVSAVIRHITLIRLCPRLSGSAPSICLHAFKKKIITVRD